MDVNAKTMWIGRDWMLDMQPIGRYPVAFRRDIELEALPQTAEIRITASENYGLWINGHTAGYGPARSFPSEKIADVLDIAPYLQAGTNQIAVIADMPTGAAGSNAWSRFGMWIELEATIGDRKFAFGSDSMWKVRSADWFVPSHLYTCLATGYQEHVDARKEPKDWRTAPAEEGWHPAWPIGPAGTPPWERLVDRDVPLLVETAYRPELVWEGRAGRTIRDVRDNIAAIFNEEQITGGTCEDADRFGTDDIWRSETGHVRVFDFGRTRFIRPGIEIVELEGDARIEFFYALELGERPTAMVGFGTAEEGFGDSFAPDAAGARWEAFYPRGFRYMTVVARGEGNCGYRLASRTVDYPYGEMLPCPSADDELRAIWRVSADTIRSSTNDAIVDTCSREDNLWTLDACLTGKAAFYTFGDTAMWRRCLRLIGQGVDAAGIPRSIVPAETTYICLFDQALYWVVSCGEYVRLTGDATLSADVREPARRLLAQCQALRTEEGLFVPPAFSWYWLDWVQIDKRPYSLAINALLLSAADAAAELAAQAGDAELGALAADIGGALRTALLRFYDEEDGCFVSHLDPAVPVAPSNPMNAMGQNGNPPKHDLHGNALALRTGVGSDEQRARTAAWLAGQVRGAATEAPYPFGIGWTDIILEPLHAYGYRAEAEACAKKLYGAVVEAGAPTWGEDFNPHPHNTAHGWGSSVNSLIAVHWRN